MRDLSIATDLRNLAAGHFGWKSQLNSLRQIDAGAQNGSAHGCGCANRATGRSLRVYNTHQYMTEPARVEAVRVILAMIEKGESGGSSACCRRFQRGTRDTGSPALRGGRFHFDCRARASASTVAPTYQFYGIRLRRLDDILVNRGWQVVNHQVVDAKPDNIFPSDHFGVMADLILENRGDSNPTIR